MGIVGISDSYLKSLEYDDNNPIILEHLGDVYVSLNDSKEALLLYQKALQNDVIFIPFCFHEAAANLLTNSALDPYGKIPELKYCAAKIEVPLKVN